MNGKKIAERISVLQPTAVNRVLNEVRQLQSNGRKLVSLMRGQPDSPTPPHIVLAAEQSLRAGRTGYADNQGELRLREAIAEKLLREQGLTINPDREVLVTDGATCGLALALGATLNPGDEILVPDPIYDAYASPIAMFGGRAISVRSTIRDGRFTVEADDLEAACTARTRALLLNHPWNPVGTVFAEHELRSLGRVVQERGLILISDEIYESLVYDNRKYVSAATLPELAGRTILANSLSKTYAMTGWRVGFCVGPESVIQAMLLLLQQFSRGPATFVQDAAAVALSHNQDCVRQLTAEYQARRDLVVKRLQGIAGIEACVPDGGLFVMLNLRDLMGDLSRPNFTSNDVRRFLLKEVGVVVLHGGAYGPSSEGMLRISFAGGGEALDRGLTLLRDGLSQIASERQIPPSTN